MSNIIQSIIRNIGKLIELIKKVLPLVEFVPSDKLPLKKTLAVSLNGLALIKKFEGYSGRIYICPGGYPTIGYGHLVVNEEVFSDGINEKTALKLLVADCKKAEQSVNKLIKIDLNQNQFDALVSFVYNLGGDSLARSTLRKRINNGEQEKIAEEFSRWIWADGKKLDGLINRRTAESTLYLKKS